MARQNYKQTKKAIYEAKVEQAGNLGQSINDFKVESLGVIEDILGDFILKVQDNINNIPQFVVTGAINKLEVKAENGVVNVYAPKHLIFQDRGVNGAVNKLYDTPHSFKDKKPPVQVFKDWIKRKNINLINEEKYDVNGASPFKELTEEQKITKAAWGMATNVYKNGIKPKKILSKEYPELIKNLENEIADFSVQYLIQQFDFINPTTKRVII